MDMDNDGALRQSSVEGQSFVGWLLAEHDAGRDACGLDVRPDWGTCLWWEADSDEVKFAPWGMDYVYANLVLMRDDAGNDLRRFAELGDSCSAEDLRNRTHYAEDLLGGSWLRNPTPSDIEAAWARGHVDRLRSALGDDLGLVAAETPVGTLCARATMDDETGIASIQTYLLDEARGATSPFDVTVCDAELYFGPARGEGGITEDQPTSCRVHAFDGVNDDPVFVDHRTPADEVAGVPIPDNERNFDRWRSDPARLRPGDEEEARLWAKPDDGTGRTAGHVAVRRDAPRKATKGPRHGA